jgi:hypothetical protein
VWTYSTPSSQPAREIALAVRASSAPFAAALAGRLAPAFAADVLEGRA